MLFGPNIHPERQKLRLIQLISQDTPSTPNQDGQRFCVFLRYEPDSSEPRQILLEQEADQAMAQLGLSGISVYYGGELVVLVKSQEGQNAIRRLLGHIDAPYAYVVSPEVIGESLIPRAYRIAQTELRQRLFRNQRPAMFLSKEDPSSSEAPLSAQDKDAERRLFLKLVNLDFDGAAICAQELLSTLGMAGRNDIALMKLRLFCLLENAAWFLAFRSGKDQCMSHVTPRYLGDFLGAENIDRLLTHTAAFIRLLEREFSPSDSSSSQWINRILAYISDHYMEPRLTVTAIARHFGLSPQQLSRDFGRLVGTSPSAYLMEIRLDRAKQLLRDTGLSNEEIAAHVGFGSPRRLYRALQHSDGVTPGQYRKQQRSPLEESE